MADHPPPAPPIGVRDLLRIPDFRRLYLAQAISDLGDGMTYLALFLLVLRPDRLDGGDRADVDPRRAAAGHDRPVRRRLGRPPRPPPDHGRVGHPAGRGRRWSWSSRPRASALPALFVLACLQAVIGTFFSPARMAMVPRVVPAEGLLAANSLGQATRMIVGVVGRRRHGPHRRGPPGWCGPCSSSTPATFLVSVRARRRRDAARPGRPTRGAAAEREGARHGCAVADGLRLIAGRRRSRGARRRRP